MKLLQDAEKYKKAHRRKKWWYRVVTCLAAVVVFCTTYALILPAITMEGEVCGLQEHTHSVDCYTQVTSVSVQEPVCTPESLNLHQHTQACYDDTGNLICGYADYVIHTHNASCYTGDGTLWCPLREVGTHVHGESCYWIPEAPEVHVHTEECYAPERGQLICEIPEVAGHIHGADCYLTNSTLICELPESEGHAHGDGCYDENGALICEQEESEGHFHGEGCYETQTDLICEIPEDPGHQHTDECYEWNQVLICELSTEPVEAEEPAEPVLICERPEIILHTHTEACFDESGNVVCGKIQILEHQHTEDCFRTVELDADTETLTCTLAEGEGAHTHGEGCYDEDGNLVCGLEENAGHRHNALCYGTWELTCGLPEHVHTEACLPEKEPETVYFCGKEVHTHDETCYDEAGELTCALEEHVHTEACLREEEPEPVYLCGREAHTHDETCYDEAGELICALEEHVHTEACLAEEEPEPVYFCGREVHSHNETCYDEEGALTCTLEEHIHSEACRQASGLTEEEQAQVDAVIALIDALPTSEEANEILTALEESEDVAGQESYLEQIQPRIEEAFQAYDALTEGQRACVGNAEKLMALDWLRQERIIHAYPALTEDGAMVSELMATGAKVVLPELGSSPGTPATVRNGDMIHYSFSIKTSSYTEACFGEGRVKLEFVLPLSAERAAFDLTAMPWLDTAEGYAPSITTETRVMGEQELICQVLTGYKLLTQQGESGPVIPGEFTETVAVSVLDVAYGENIAVQISAAMEQNNWDGVCEAHQIEEKLTVVTDPLAVVCSLSEEELQAIYEQFLAEVEELEAFGELNEEMRAAAEDLLQRLQEAHQLGQLSDERFTELYERVFTVLYGDPNSIAEAAVGSNWILLRDSGWFNAYSSYAGRSYSQASAASYSRSLLADGGEEDAAPSSVQIVDKGGTKTSDDGTVSVSKTISGTDLENVFDITLQVQTSVNVAEICEEPDMAVVIVMDISNTMNSDFGGVTRYAAAMSAAEDFLDEFADNNSLGISKVGYVAFNTNAHQIFGLQSCATAEQANALKNTMRTQTGSIINASGYNESHSRFTNVEAGLAMAADMLSGVSNKNKYIIFLSDGFPTTYISSGYSGYDPYDSTGRFYDHVLNKPCLYGTSYSDEAAIRARNKATAIKNSGVTIFSIGVDVAGQTIQKYITQSETASGFSVVDRTGTTYEIGDASSTEAYKNWLRNSIGSGYYYDSTDSSGLMSAYNQIFEEIKHQVEAGSQADWVASDPIPTVNGSTETVEFIGFYNQTPELVFTDLEGNHVAGGENTASFSGESSAISWDLKQSGYLEMNSGGTTTYTYTLTYRVRLKNENGGFTEDTVYPTNDTTTLQYRTIQGTDGNLTVSEPKTVEFPIPSVEGYLSELIFDKVKANDQPLAGAEFTLHHDTDHCSICRGDGSSVSISDMTAVSDEDGAVTFTNIPSGHQYILTETIVPDGYSASTDNYQVIVAYDTLTVKVVSSDGTEKEWAEEIKNYAYHELPETGGVGTYLYTLSGIALLALSLMYILKRRKGAASP